MASDFHSQIKGMFQLLFVGIYSVAQDKKCGFAVVFVQGIYKFVRISSGTVVKGKGNILCLFYRYLASGNLVGVFGFNFDICSTVFLSFYFTFFTVAILLSVLLQETGSLAYFLCLPYFMTGSIVRISFFPN